MIGTAAVERTAAWLLWASLGLVAFNLLAAQVLFGLAALLWLRLVWTERHVPLPSFALPLAVYALLTVVSAVVSIDPARSLPDLKQLVLFLMVPLVMRLGRGAHAMRALDVVIAFGAVGAVLGVVQYSMLGFDNLGQRPQGTLTHYMTYSGVVMLVLCAAAARLIFHGRQWTWPAVAIPALAVALVFTQTRNAWIGAAAGVGTLLAMRNRRMLIVVPLVAVLVLAVAPPSLRQRAFSIADLEDESNRDRLQMLAMGVAMVRDYPVFGVGPDMVLMVYPEYRPENYVHELNFHLHNVPVQIAAERGLPALAAWLTFITMAVAGLFGQVRRGPARAVAGAGLAAIVAMLAAGLFEYNFGDSEFLMLLLGLITLPYAARAGDGTANPDDRPAEARAR